MSGTPDIKELFNDLIELPDDARRAHLDRRCGDDTALRERVEALLQAYQTAGALLADPTIGQHAGLHAPGTAPEAGQMIGPYQLLERVGEGGFGEVWTAEQSAPVRRRVAIKVIKAGMDTREVLARFEAERQALALMDHPNIARVIDAGAIGPVQTPVNGVCGSETTTSPPAAGRPYFVMEHVAGIPITEYCDAGRLPVRRRLALFAQVCDAVQHAHGKGIIHRDLKPSNILVTPDERGAAAANGFGVPKVIDFGIAKATTTPLAERTLLTAPGGLMGTPAYMSPEQAGSSGVDVDTRSDVYSLGVILYQLLTGTLPFEPRMLREADHATLVKVIRELEPPRPSTRLSTLAGERVNQHGGATPQEIAARRDVEFSALQRQLRGELDWVVMKCLEKDRTRRYETAHALALDVERYLRNEPVQAGPPSRVYHFRKFVRRNRAAVTAAAFVSAALLAGMGGTTFGLLRAEERRAEAEAAREREREQRELAETRERELEQVSDFQSAMLGGVDVEMMGRGIQDRYREQARAALERQQVGEYPDRRPRTPEEIDLAMAAFDQVAQEVEAADVARGVMDEFVLARAGEALQKEFTDQPLVQAQLRESIGSAYMAIGLYSEAEPYLRSALEIRERELGGAHELVATSLVGVGDLLREEGDYVAAGESYVRALDMLRSLGGDHDAGVVSTLNNLGQLLVSMGKSDEAVPLLQQALAIEQGLERADRRGEAAILANLGLAMRQQRDLEGAQAALEQALAIERSASGLNNLALIMKDKRDLDAAERLYKEAIEINRRERGHDHPDVGSALNNLARLMCAKEDYVSAAPLLREALETSRATLPHVHPHTAIYLHHLGEVLGELGEPEEAERLVQESLAMYRAHPEWSLVEHRHALDVLGEIYVDTGRVDKAEPVLHELLDWRRREHPAGSPELATALSRTGSSFVRIGLYEVGTALLREGLAIRERAYSTDHPDAWLVYRSKTMIGGALRREGEGVLSADRRRGLELFAEAEAILLGCYDDMKGDPRLPAPRAGIPDLKREALEGIVKLYETWAVAEPEGGKAEQAARWRLELEGLARP